MAIFDDTMKARLLAFKRANGLPGDAVADTQTWALLASPAPAKATAPTEPQAKATATARTTTEPRAQEKAPTTIEPQAKATPKPNGVVLTKEQVPLTYELAATPATIDGVLDFLAAHGCDIRAVLADMDRILEAKPTS